MLEEGMMSFALLGAGWVLWLLVGLSIACIAISFERAFYLLRDNTPAAELQRAVEAFLAGGVTFCGMRPLRSLPFQVICVLGLDDDAANEDERSD